MQATSTNYDEQHGTENPHVQDFELLRSNEMVLNDFSDELLYPVEASSSLSAPEDGSSSMQSSFSAVTPAQISDFSPDWDFTDGGAKILICLASPLQQCPSDSQSSIFVQFGILTRVPAEKVSDTVVRCTGMSFVLHSGLGDLLTFCCVEYAAPPSNSTGSKEIYVCCSRDQLHPECTQLSSKRMFTYKSHPSSTRSSETAVQESSAGKRGRSPRFADEAGLTEVRKRNARAVESSTLSSFVDTDCTFRWGSGGRCHSTPANILASVFSFAVDERQCKIRVVERLSEFHHAIWTATPPAGVRGSGDIDASVFPKSPGAHEVSVPAGTSSEDCGDAGLPPSAFDDTISTDSSSTSMLGLDDSTIETLSDKDLEQLSESLLERVVRQLVTVAHTNEELLEELNSLDEAGLSLLHYVSFYNYSQLVPLLLSHGGDINQQSTQGQSALHLAAGCGHTDVVDVLVRSGADLFALDFDGYTAADRAEKSDHTELAVSLRRLMGCSDDMAATLSGVDKTGERGGVVEFHRDVFAMDIDFNAANFDGVTRSSELGGVEFGSPARSCGSPVEPSGAGAKSKNYVSVRVRAEL